MADQEDLLAKMAKQTQALYDAIVGTLENPGMAERQRDHEQRIRALETSRQGWAERLQSVVASILVAVASAFAALHIQAKH